MHTEEEAKCWVQEHQEELLASLLASEEVPNELKKIDSKFTDVWCAGCWLNDKLTAVPGTTKEEIDQIGFAHGQRSLFGNTYEWAVRYLNEREQRGSVQDKPGRELSDKINAEYLG